MDYNFPQIGCCFLSFAESGDNEKCTIDRSDLTSGNYDTAEQTTVMTDGEAPVSPPETVIAIILAGLIRSGAVS